jgi:hypothetical protein
MVVVGSGDEFAHNLKQFLRPAIAESGSEVFE